MLERLAERGRVSWIEAIGTDPRYPVTEGWPHLVRQLIDTLESEHGGKPVYGVGHSLGGYLTYLAAVRRPELFRAIVLLDAPIIGAFRGGMLGATKRLGIVDRVTPAGATRERRSHWRTREEAKAHFGPRPLFRRFTERCLDDYVRHGLAEAPQGVVAAGVVAVLGGLMFKAGGVPGHYWVPDAAEGAGGAVAAFLTTVPKIGAMVAAYRLIAMLPDTLAWPLLVAHSASVRRYGLIGACTRPGASIWVESMTPYSGGSAWRAMAVPRMSTMSRMFSPA